MTKKVCDGGKIKHAVKCRASVRNVNPLVLDLTTDAFSDFSVLLFANNF